MTRCTKYLTFSWRKPLSYRNQSIDLQSKSMYWFLYDDGLRLKRVNRNTWIKKRAQYRLQLPKNIFSVWTICALQKQPFAQTFFKIEVLKKFAVVTEKAPVSQKRPEEPAISLKRDYQHRCFPLNIANFLITDFL